MDLAKLGLWPIRVAWFVLLGVSGFGFREILANTTNPLQTVAEVMLWATWFVGLVALLAPSTVSLTVFRIIAPASVVSPLLGALLARTWTWPVLSAIGVGLIITVLALSPPVGDVMVNGSSYGPERRLALRPPGALLVGPIQLAWLGSFFGIVTGPLLIANANYVIGPIALAVGLVVANQTTRSLHQLSRRWAVFVPAGFVIHDYWVLAESILLRRKTVRALGPAALDIGNYLDLSANARGLALMVQLEAKVPLALRAKGDIQTFSAHRLIFAPTLPGSLLREARLRGIRIGSDPQLLDVDEADEIYETDEGD